MNTIDIICLVIILIFTLIGIWHGFLRGIFRLLDWAAAIAGAYFASSLLSETISETLQTSPFSTALVCYCIGFIVPFLTLLFISHLVNKAITGSVAGRADRILGGVFGVIKAILICFVIMTILHILPFNGVVSETRNDSVAYSAYKGCLEAMGYSSEPLDLVGVAERKASEFTKNMANKATEKATEAAQEKVNEMMKEASEKAVNASNETIQKTIDSIANEISKQAE